MEQMSEPMNEEPDWDEAVAKMREAGSKSRGYASYWEWSLDKSVAEVGVAEVLAKYLAHAEECSWESVSSIVDDPPDVLLRSTSGECLGVEVTELVHADTVKRHRYQKNSGSFYPYEWANWTVKDATRLIVELIKKKDCKLANQIDRYDQLYVAICTDEPLIDLEFAQLALGNIAVEVKNI